MIIEIDKVEARILGALIEKEITTPDYYPLTLNSLITACNQKSNRYPIMTLDETTTLRALGNLREKKLVWQVKTPGSRSSKFEHNLKEKFNFSKSEISIICVLLLRGHQTSGELKTRTNRLYQFESTVHIDSILKHLSENTENGGPFVVKLPRLTGQKESRYGHLFCGDINIDEYLEETVEPARAEIITENKRIESLEQKVASLENELLNLKNRFETFIKEFD